MTEEVQPGWISNFWRRIGALFIDALILGIAGLILGLFLESTFVQIGAWGQLIGFSISLIYFGVMNSSVSGGQTIGKKILNIRVVDSNNAQISPGKSVFRYIILGVPFYLNGVHLTNEAMQSFILYPLSLIIFGGFLSILYLYIFNRITRQSLHDLIVGTYVVNADVEKQEIGKVWKFHFIIVAMLFLLAAIIPAFTTPLAQTEPFKGMLTVQSALSSDPDVTYATISSGSTTYSSTNKGTGTVTYVNSQVFLKTDIVKDTELARRLAAIVIANYPEALQKDTIQITLTYGFDIGIASRWSNHTYSFNPDEFQAAE